MRDPQNARPDGQEPAVERNLSYIYRKGLAGGLAGCVVRILLKVIRFSKTDMHDAMHRRQRLW